RRAPLSRGPLPLPPGPARAPADFVHARARPAAHCPFLRAEVAIGERGDLRHMCDAQTLILPSELPQLLADHLGDAAADARVDFVENQGARFAAAPRGDRPDGELETRQLAAEG